MSGQQPWQAPDGRWYLPRQGPLPTVPSPSARRPEQPDQERDKKSRGTLREWLTTAAGITTSIVAVVGLLAGGTAVTVKILTPSPSPLSKHRHNITPTPPRPTSPNPTSPNPPSPLNTAQLQAALLPTGTLGSAAIMQSEGTNLSQIAAICGGPVSGDTATAYEAINNQQAGTFLDETLVSWRSTTDAGQAISSDRQAVDESGSCSFAASGATEQYEGDDPGSPPSSCVNSGQYFATQVSVSSPSSSSIYFGFVTEAQCGTTTISVEVESDLPGGVTQQTADGYLNSAIGALDSANS
jgi:hypothetical protein